VDDQEKVDGMDAGAAASGRPTNAGPAAHGRPLTHEVAAAPGRMSGVEMAAPDRPLTPEMAAAPGRLSDVGTAAPGRPLTPEMATAPGRLSGVGTNAPGRPPGVGTAVPGRPFFEALSPLSLAFLGDAVFELMVREMVLSRGNLPVNKAALEAKRYSRASGQAAMFHRVRDFLTEDEKDALRRGRNAKSDTRAKNATVSDYRHATGLEALFGYLYLKGDKERLREVFGMCVVNGKQSVDFEKNTK